MQDIRLVALDLDGTVFNDKKEITPRTLGLTRAQVMAVGDSGNDCAMIEAAGLGVAMGNATDDIKKIADVTTDDNNHDGVAAAIENYVL